VHQPNEQRRSRETVSKPAHSRKSNGTLLALGGSKGIGSRAVATAEQQAERHGLVEVEPGLRIRYDELGHGPQTLIVLNELAEMAPLAKERRLVAITSRGRRGSDRLEDLSRHNVSYEADDVEAVRSALGIERFALLGWSYPGFVAALYAARHPARVSHLVMVCPAPPYLDPTWPPPAIDPEMTRQIKELRESPLWESDQAEACRRAARIFASFRMTDQEKASTVSVDRCEWPNEWPAYAWRVGRQVQSTLFDIRDQLGSITAKTLIFHGDRDFTPVAAAEAWAALIPGAKLIRMSDAGHYLPVEWPDRFFPGVLSLLRT
jgi:proline iminopeptidase